jgi:hypothetical protein
MIIDTYIIYESLEGLLCYNIIGGVGVPMSLRHNGLSMVRIRGSSLGKIGSNALQPRFWMQKYEKTDVTEVTKGVLI